MSEAKGSPVRRERRHGQSAAETSSAGTMASPVELTPHLRDLPTSWPQPEPSGPSYERPRVPSLLA